MVTRTTTNTLIFGIIFLPGSGCERQESASKSSPDELAKTSPERCVVIYVNNWTISPSHGCYTNASPAQTMEQVLNCGETGRSSQLRFKWVPSDDVVDHYQLQWETTVDQASADSTVPSTTRLQKEIAFYGDTLVAMENDRQRVVLYPCKQDHPPRVDDATPRSP